MRVLVACEESQIVCKAFRKRGHEAFSCDIQDCSGGKPQWHIKDDVINHIYSGWDLMVAHPPCTYNSNSGNRWLYEDSSKCTAAERLVLRDAGLVFFLMLQNAPIEKIAIENPEPHPYVKSVVGDYQDKIQPWMFGDPETKGVCLWLKNLPPLMSTIIETTRKPKVHTMPAGPERARERSKFFPNMAEAMAAQWG